MKRIEQIYEAALKLYSQYGFQKVNIQEIADAAGVSKKTIYNHFSGKDDLFHRTIQWDTKGTIKFHEDIIADNSLNLMEKLILLTNHASLKLSNFNSIIYQDLIRPNPYLNDTPNNYIHKNLRTVLSVLIDQAKEQGFCRIDYSTQMITHFFLSMSRGLLSWDAPINLSNGNDNLFESAITLLLESLLTEKGRAALPVNHQDLFKTL